MCTIRKTPGARLAAAAMAGVALLVLSGGCGSKAREAPPPVTWDGPGTGTVGAGGGAVALTDGPHLAIPAGALAADTAITITRATPGPLPGGLTPVFQFEPAGTTFAAPATVTFALPAGATSALLLWSAPGSADRYEKIPVRISGAAASAQVGHFSSGYLTSAVGSDPPPADSCPPPNSDPCARGHWETWGTSGFCVFDEHAPDGTGCWPPAPSLCEPPTCTPPPPMAPVNGPETGTWRGGARGPWDGHCDTGICVRPPYYDLYWRITGDAPPWVHIAVDGCGTGEITTTARSSLFYGLVSCTYWVTASAPGYTFDPPMRTVTVRGAEVSGVDFRGIRNTYEVSGTVRGAVAGGVGVALGGDASASAVTAPDGQYHFYGLADGSYTLTPSLAGYGFAPESRSVRVSGRAVAGQDFTASATGHTLSGTVGGAVAASVTVALAGASSATAVTDAQGRYAFGFLADGRYTVTPGQVGYAFAPQSRTVDLAGADVGGQDFTASPVSGTHRISGYVTGTGGASVTVALSGAASAATITTASGTYEFLVLDGVYAVTPSRAGWRFEPPQQFAVVQGKAVFLADFVAARSGEWTPVASGTSLQLSAVCGRGPSDAWAVGDGGTILRWDGGSWSAMASGTAEPLFAAWAVAPPPWLPDAGPYAVGPWVGGYQNTLLYWDEFGAPPLWRSGFDNPGGNVFFHGIWGSGADGDLWAVGYDIRHAASASGLWQAVPHPLAGTTAGFAAVWGAGAADVWVVGADSWGAAPGGRILHWDGSAWKLASFPGSPALHAVWGSGPADVWAAGEGPVLLHWDGSAWSDRSADLPVTCPDDPLYGRPDCRVNALWGSGVDDVWAVGYVDNRDLEAPEKGGVAFHWDGANWTRSHVLAPVELRGVWGSGPGAAVWAVGEGGTILRWVP